MLCVKQCHKALVNQSFSCYLLSRTAISASVFIEIIWRFAADFGKWKHNHTVLLIACIFREHSSLIRAPYIARICTHKPQTLLKLPPIHGNLKSIKQSSKLGGENLSFQHNYFALFWCGLVAQCVQGLSKTQFFKKQKTKYNNWQSTMIGKYKFLTPGSFWHLLEELVRASNWLSPFLDKTVSHKWRKHSPLKLFVNHQPPISRAAIALAIRDSNSGISRGQIQNRHTQIKYEMRKILISNNIQI